MVGTVSSLNVSVAASLLLYEAWRRGEAGDQRLDRANHLNTHRTSHS